jgi:hypothetical protein
MPTKSSDKLASARNTRKCTLLPRIFRLRSVLLDNLENPSLESFLQQEFSVVKPRELVADWLAALSRITEIAAAHAVVVWGMRIHATALAEHLEYIKAVSSVPFDIAYNLPHLRALKLEWEDATKTGQKEYRRAEARYNKRKKRERRF